MVATQTQLRRGTGSQCDAAIPAEGELWVDMTLDNLRLGDGLRTGGFPIPNAFNIQQDTYAFSVAGGTANALTVTLLPVPSGYAQPLRFRFKATGTNTGATTIDVNSLGVKNILRMNAGSLSALTAGDIVTGGIYEVIYDGVQFQLVTVYNSGLVSISQGDINTAFGSFSQGATTNLVSGALSCGITSITLPGGQYGFTIVSSGPGGIFDNNGGWWLGAKTSTYAGATAWVNSGTGLNVGGGQRYITSSPPYNMGDGEVGGFFFVLVNSSGEIEGHYAADAPPWAYNGPTDIRASYKCPITKKKFRSVAKKRTLQMVLDGEPESIQLEEITDDIKNADMTLIPHPFGELSAGQHVVMLDPMSDMTRRIVEHQNSGGWEEVIEAINKGHIKIDNTPIKRSGPCNVKPCKFTYKRT